MGMEPWILRFSLDLAGMIVTMDVSYYMNRRLVFEPIITLFYSPLIIKASILFYGINGPK